MEICASTLGPPRCYFATPSGASFLIVPNAGRFSRRKACSNNPIWEGGKGLLSPQRLGGALLKPKATRTAPHIPQRPTPISLHLYDHAPSHKRPHLGTGSSPLPRLRCGKIGSESVSRAFDLCFGSESVSRAFDRSRLAGLCECFSNRRVSKVNSRMEECYADQLQTQHVTPQPPQRPLSRGAWPARRSASCSLRRGSRGYKISGNMSIKVGGVEEAHLLFS